MIEYVKLYAIALGFFVLIDGVWLGIVAKNFYAKELAHLFTVTPNWPAAVLFYLIFLAGLLYFVVSPNLAGDSLLPVIIAGAVFGFVTYATYDLTNLATIPDWPIRMVIVDILWGTVLAAGVSTGTVWIARMFQIG